MTDFPHSDEHKECPLCKQRAVFTDVDYKNRTFILSCLRCSYREVKEVGKTIKQWKWRWADFKSIGLRKDA